VNESLRRLSLAAYAVSFFFIFSFFADVATNVWPWDLGNEQWRYGLAAITSNYLVSVLFALLMTAGVATALGQRLLVRLVGIFSIVLAVFLSLMVIGLLLDYFQVVGAVAPEVVTPFRIGFAKAGIKLGTVAIVLVILGIGAFKAARLLPVKAPRDRNQVPLVR
jgi:hypothetical protein